MTTSDQRRRTEIHEASHGVIAASLQLSVKFLSVRPTEHYGGIMVPARRRRPLAPHDPKIVGMPLPLWPTRTRRLLERSVFVSLAGPVGSLYLGPRVSGFVAPSEDEARAEADARALARLHPATRDAVLWHEAAAEPEPGDEHDATQGSVALVGGREAAAYLGWARQAVAHLVIERAAWIEAVADELASESVISGRRMLAVMRSVPLYGAAPRKERTNQ